MDMTLPMWARAALKDSKHTVSENLSAAAYPKEPPRKLVQFAQDDSHEFIQRWLSIYRSRSRYALNNTELWDMTRTLGRIADEVLGNIQIFGEGFRNDPAHHYVASATWHSLVKAGLCNLCEEVVGALDFFDEFSSWVLDIMKIIDAIMSYCRHITFKAQDRPTGLYEPMCRLARQVWSTCWCHRDILVDGNQLERVVPGIARELRLHLRSMLCSHHLLKTEESFAPRNGALHEAGLHLMCWMRHDEPCDSNFEIQSAFAFISTMKQPRELARFMESEVIRQYGAEGYLLRLCITLRDTQLEDRALSTILSVQQTVLSNKAFVPHFVTTGVLGALCNILERENDRTVPEPGIVSSIAESTVDIFGWITEEVPLAEGAAVLIREHNIFHLIARYILQLSKTLTARGLDYVLKFCRANEHLGQRLAARSGKNALRKDYQRALRQEWAPLLIALDNLPTLNHPDGARIIKLVRQGWWRLGSVGAGFNEEKEKKEYERRAEKMCSWRECCWHTIEPPSPTKLCQGCGDARYCGSPCQRRDWKGGHKRACRRLKNAAHHGPVH